MDGLPGSGRQSAEVAARTHTADEDALVERVPGHSDLVAQDGPACERTTRIDGNHAHRLLAIPDHLHQRISERALARAGRSGQANQVGVAGMRLQFGDQVAGLRITIFCQADGPRQRPDIAGKQGAGQAHTQLIVRQCGGKAFAVKSEPRSTVTVGPLLGAATGFTTALKKVCSQMTVALAFPPEPSRISVWVTRCGLAGPALAFKPAACSSAVTMPAGVGAP